MVTERMRLLECESIYWVIINADIEDGYTLPSVSWISKQHNQKTVQYPMEYEEGHGNLLELISLPFMPRIIFTL